MSALQSLFAVVLPVALGLGVLLDLWSLYAWLKRNRLGQGPSGVAGASWFLYFSYCVWRRSFLLLVGLTVFHVSCQYLVPLLHRRWCGTPGSAPE
ncbi:MAG: hypothetical protein NTY77_18100 [Elusimicrobia bacterium]|nr:hypothetical protein [Elusimicrobiota bacterium]